MDEMIKIIEQTKLVRELQKMFFISRKDGGRWPSKESRDILKQSKIEEIKLDEMLEKIQIYNL